MNANSDVSELIHFNPFYWSLLWVQSLLHGFLSELLFLSLLQLFELSNYQRKKLNYCIHFNSRVLSHFPDSKDQLFMCFIIYVADGTEGQWTGPLACLNLFSVCLLYKSLLISLWQQCNRFAPVWNKSQTCFYEWKGERARFYPACISGKVEGKFERSANQHRHII